MLFLASMVLTFEIVYKNAGDGRCYKTVVDVYAFDLSASKLLSAYRFIVPDVHFSYTNGPPPPSQGLSLFL